MSGVEISFTILVDKNGHYQILPTAMDYPERFERPAGPGQSHHRRHGLHFAPSPGIPGLAGAGRRDPRPAPHPAMAEQGILRPCVLYPGCFVSFDGNFEPTAIRVCEINIRPGEPEFQPVVKRLRNLGALVAAMADGHSG